MGQVGCVVVQPDQGITEWCVTYEADTIMIVFKISTKEERNLAENQRCYERQAVDNNRFLRLRKKVNGYIVKQYVRGIPCSM
jgi:ribosomal protein L44E